MDMKHKGMLLLILISALGWSCGVPQTSMQNDSVLAKKSYDPNKNYVLPVILASSDWKIRDVAATYKDTIADILKQVQEFYRTHNNGKTVKYLAAIYYQSQKSNQWFWCKTQFNSCAKGNFEANAYMELLDLNHKMFNQNMTVMIIAFGGGSYAGGRDVTSLSYQGRYWEAAGTMIVGEHGILLAKHGKICELLKPVHPGDKSQEACLNNISAYGTVWGTAREIAAGTVAHELGHTFGLMHPSAEQSNMTVMGQHVLFPKTGLLASEKNKIRYNRFLQY